MKNISEKIAVAGLRMTPLRKVILDVFENASGPMTVPELQEYLEAKGECPNKTTLYRQIENLIEAGVLEEVQLESGVLHYELKQHHHHHFTCNSCGTIECIADEKLEVAVHNLMDKLADRGMKAKAHSFNLSGKCSDC